MAKSQISPLSDFSSLVPALSKLIEGVGNAPIRLSVSLCDAEEIKEYKDRITELECELERLRANFNRSEYLFRCESLYNARLLDFIREHGLNVPSTLFSPDLD